MSVGGGYHIKMKKRFILVFVLSIVLLGTYVFYYSLRSKSPPSDQNELTQAQKETKLREVSQSLTIQKETPQFKTKLEEMSKSLNKK